MEASLDTIASYHLMPSISWKERICSEYAIGKTQKLDASRALFTMDIGIIGVLPFADTSHNHAEEKMHTARFVGAERRHRKAGEEILSKFSWSSLYCIKRDFRFTASFICLSHIPFSTLSQWIIYISAWSAHWRGVSASVSRRKTYYSAGWRTIYASIHVLCIREIVEFLRCTHYSSPGHGGDQGGLNGFYKTYGIAGMLEAKEYKNTREVGPLLGKIVDCMCAERSEAPVTDVFVRHTNEALPLLRERNPFECTPRTTVDISRNIHEFRKLATAVFGIYQKSGMASLKMHMLNNVPEALARFSGL